TIGTKEQVRLVTLSGQKIDTWAKIDTGAWRTSIDRTLAQESGLLDTKNVLWSKTFKGALGTEKRPIINLKYYLAGRRINTLASVADRSKLRRPLIIGRRDLTGFLVKA
ncbi:MAG: RimK/LysX family protein, partial [Candidatus Microgenomates bacterium]